MTPAMFDRIAERKLKEQEREDLLFGILNSTIANFSLGAGENPRKPSDFMLRPPKSRKAEPAAETPQERAERIHNRLVAMFGQPQLTAGE